MLQTYHAGLDYQIVLRGLHQWLKPRTYLEIGTLDGLTLGLSTCPSIAIDPAFQVTDARRITNKPESHMFQLTSDDFFARHDPVSVLGGPIDLAFLDGMHHCEFLLRDFINTEKHCLPRSVVVLHDCLPVETGMTERDRSKVYHDAPHHQGWWTGDVWRTALALKRCRPDLRISTFDAPPSGLVVISNLNPGSNALSDQVHQVIELMLSWQFDRAALYAALALELTAAIDTEEKLLARFPRAA